jgi:hypothetical protein
VAKRVLTHMTVQTAKGPDARTCSITLHWQPLDDLAGAYVEVLTFNGSTAQFRAARRCYEALHKAGEAVEGPF